MYKMKKAMTVALTASMVLGSAMTVFAADTTGSATGAGTSEGHLEKKVTNVVLPTDGDTSVFAYTIDPERLIQETEGGKYDDGTVFPQKDSDTGVYFLVDTNKYDNTSKALTVTNKSSHDITLTVTAKAADANTSTDIALAETSTITGENPQLYLGFTLGTETKAVKTSDVSISANVAGIPANFKTVVKDDKSGYEYKEIPDGTEGKAAWKTVDISMTGACNVATIASTLTAPTVTVTWKWEETPADAAPSIATAEKTKTLAADTAVAIQVSLGNGDLAADGVSKVEPKVASNYDLISKNIVSYSDGVITVPAATVNAMLASPSTYFVDGKCVLVVTFDDEAETSVEVTLNAPAE